MTTQSKRVIVVLFAALVIGAALSAVLVGPAQEKGIFVMVQIEQER